MIFKKFNSNFAAYKKLNLVVFFVVFQLTEIKAKVNLVKFIAMKKILL